MKAMCTYTEMCSSTTKLVSDKLSEFSTWVTKLVSDKSSETTAELTADYNAKFSRQ
jgi:hypothetical protein